MPTKTKATKNKSPKAVKKTPTRVKAPTPLAVVAVAAAKHESGFTVHALTTKGIPRCAVMRAVNENVLKVLKDPLQTGKRGRPATRFTLTLKGQGLAKRSLAAA